MAGDPRLFLVVCEPATTTAVTRVSREPQNIVDTCKNMYRCDIKLLDISH